MTNSNEPFSTGEVIDPVFFDDVIRGLSQPQKELQCKYFYDERGSALFDQICELEEYYLTRTERKIMVANAREMAEQIGAGAMLVQFGSGSSLKTRVLLDALIEPAAYVPLDISEEHLIKTSAELRECYPDIEILPLVADFTESFELPVSKIEPSHAAVFFPGSTIGNFLPAAATQMMKTIAGILGPDGGMLIGIDLQKEPSVIEAAYNDSKGVTDEFNLNVLHRLNNELGANFDVEQFHHKATYNQQQGRVEIFVVSSCDQKVQIGEHEFQFAAGEQIFTEYSHKYTIDGFIDLASPVGFSLHKYWTDEQNLFAVLHLVNDR